MAKPNVNKGNKLGKNVCNMFAIYFLISQRKGQFPSTKEHLIDTNQ